MFVVKAITPDSPWYHAGFTHAVVDTGFEGDQKTFIAAFESEAIAEVVADSLNESTEAAVGVLATEFDGICV